MEYKINQFNLSDINFLDLQSLINCFENCIPRQKISNIYLGPNLIHFSELNNKYKKNEEDRKLISTECELILSKFKNPELLKIEEKILFYSTSNKQSKIFLKRILKNLNKLTSQNSLGDTTELNDLLNFYNFLSFFTCIKDNFNDEIPISDFLISISIDNGIKYNKINFFQFNYEMLFNHIGTPFPNNFLDRNNIHFFYMLLYNLPYEVLYKYLYCNQTKNFFQIYQSEISRENIENMDEYVKRYVLINQFQLIKNDIQYSNFSKTNENAELIKKEYEFYKNYYEQYCKIKNFLMINSSQEQNLIGLFFAMILLCEIDFEDENIFKEISDNFNNNNYNNSIDLFSFIRNYILNDERFNYIQTKEQNEERIKSLNIFSKISFCLNISEEKIIYILLIDIMTKGQGKILQNENEIYKNSIQFITILYLISIDKIKNIFNQYNKRKKLIPTSSNNKINIYICRSNLSFENTFIINSLNDNPYFTISNNIIDCNSFIIKNNVKEHIFSNYIQEQKNFIYMNNALSNLGDERKWPKMKYNAEYLNQIYLENFYFDEIMNLYENPNYGLLKYINETSNKLINIQSFKSNFNKYIYKKGKIELVEVFDASLQQYQSYIKVKHTFGTFLYDLNNILNKNKNSNIPNIQKEQVIYKFMEYKPIMYNNNFFKFNFDNSMKIIQNLTISNQPIFINLLIELNKYNILTIFDDLKVNILYYYYSNYYNYIINVKEIRDNIINSKLLNIPSNINIKDELSFFNFLSKKIRISYNDYYYENKYIFSKGKLSNVFEKDKNISMILFKYNYESFILSFCDKVSKSKFNYFIFAIKGIKAFVKLTKIFNEKRILSNVRNLLTDAIVDNYDIISNKNSNDANNPLKFNKLLLPKIDKLNELVFDFNKESLSKILPKLRTNLFQLTKIWKDYVNDLEYLETNKKLFSNQENTQKIIEQRMINFQILLFLFSKNYKFINSESIKKYGVLVSEFTKTVSKNVLEMTEKLNKEFDDFLKSNEEFNKSSKEFRSNYEEINFEKLIIKRIEVQEISRKNSINNNNSNVNLENENKFNIPLKDLNNGRFINNSFSSKKNNFLSNSINNIFLNHNSFNTITRNFNNTISNKTFSDKSIKNINLNNEDSNIMIRNYSHLNLQKNKSCENYSSKLLNFQNGISEDNKINDCSHRLNKKIKVSQSENNLFNKNNFSYFNKGENNPKKNNSNILQIKNYFFPKEKLSSFLKTNSDLNKDKNSNNKKNNNSIPNENIKTKMNDLDNKNIDMTMDKLNERNKENNIKNSELNNYNFTLGLNNNNNKNFKNDLNISFGLQQKKNSKKFEQFINSEQNKNKDNFIPKIYTFRSDQFEKNDSFNNLDSLGNVNKENFKNNEENNHNNDNNIHFNQFINKELNNKKNEKEIPIKNIFLNKEENKSNLKDGNSLLNVKYLKGMIDNIQKINSTKNKENNISKINAEPERNMNINTFSNTISQSNKSETIENRDICLNLKDNLNKKKKNEEEKNKKININNLDNQNLELENKNLYKKENKNKSEDDNKININEENIFDESFKENSNSKKKKKIIIKK